MSTPQWGEMPALALTNIFQNLNFNERLRASSVCWHWRSVLFQRSFFKHFKFHLHIDDDQECNFFVQRLLSLTSEVTIEFDSLNVLHIDKVRRLLLIIAKNDYLVGLRFHTNSVGFEPGDEYPDGMVNIERAFVEPIKAILTRKTPSTKVLDLGAIEGLTYYANDFLKALTRPQDLREITLASIKFDPSHYPILAVEHLFFEKCASLQVLSLDYDTLNDDILNTIQLLPLKTFMICVHGLDREQPMISDYAWETFSSKFKNIKLVLTLIYAYEAVELLHHRILCRSMPLTHLRVLFCNYINIDALNSLSVYYKDTLRSVQWIDSGFQENERNSMKLYLYSDQDPFVMMSWRCKYLEEIVVHGYALDPHNLVGVSRLCGKNLKRLEASVLYPPASNMMNSFIEEISTQLGQKWRPKNPNNLHPALGYIPASDDVRDEYILDLIRSDLKN